MAHRRSLDDTCDVLLSRTRLRAPLAVHRAASENPSIRPEHIVVPFLLPRPPPKPLPLPGSSGLTQIKPVRLSNGRTHVPRPRNPFILFRCDLVHQRKTLPRSDLDDTNISRIAGDLWREMSTTQKKPWVDLAAQEKTRHALLYPDYKYAPAHVGPKTKRAKHVAPYPQDRPLRLVSQVAAPPPSDQPKPPRGIERPRPYAQSIPRRRSSSCPPVGAVPVPSNTALDEWSPPLVARDDMQRRPSRTVMYQSVAQQPAAESSAVPLVDHHPVVSSHGFHPLGAPQIDPSLLGPAYPLPDLDQSPESYPAPNFGFFDSKPISAPGVDNDNPAFTEQELTELERFMIGAAFTDPFSTLATIPVDGSLCTFPMAIPPFDYASYSTDSPFSSSSTNFSSN